MKIITLEEHYQLAEIKKAVAKFFPGHNAVHLMGYDPSEAQLEDLGADRLQHMDAMGIDVQVLSYTSAGLPSIPAAEAVPLARQINDRLAAAIQAHPDRFAGFATLPTSDPEAAAAELERAVQKLGFKGVMISGRTNGCGWHLETGIHALHMILSGTFDRYPSLQLILGHWGEMIPFYLARFDEALNPTTKYLQRPVADYFLQQMYVTPSGMFTLPPFLLTMQIMGADRIMYSVDYPYIVNNQARAFLENAPISPADKEKIAHGNAEKVLKLAPR